MSSLSAPDSDCRCSVAMNKALEDHDKLLRKALKRFYGYEVGLRPCIKACISL